MKVLIVDDDPNAREYLIDAVESLGHKVSVAEDGFMGVSLVETFNPDLVITDIQMAPLDGLGLVEHLRKYDRDLLIVVLTAFGNDEYAGQAFTLGADMYIHKPIRLRDLLALLAKCEECVTRRYALQGSEPTPLCGNAWKASSLEKRNPIKVFKNQSLGSVIGRNWEVIPMHKENVFAHLIEAEIFGVLAKGLAMGKSDQACSSQEQERLLSAPIGTRRIGDVEF